MTRDEHVTRAMLLGLVYNDVYHTYDNEEYDEPSLAADTLKPLRYHIEYRRRMLAVQDGTLGPVAEIDE